MGMRSTAATISTTQVMATQKWECQKARTIEATPAVQKHGVNDNSQEVEQPHQVV